MIKLDQNTIANSSGDFGLQITNKNISGKALTTLTQKLKIKQMQNEIKAT